ncbi:hypothetical protein Q8W14_09065 [Photobacterium damselae subsp. piscicida]|nr:hypothetical protein [Photobacterium damselae subsp. piscicida]MDP2568531.1 hypothetical protein [Photobacterium damselae subsp. piscicida]
MESPPVVGLNVDISVNRITESILCNWFPVNIQTPFIAVTNQRH